MGDLGLQVGGAAGPALDRVGAQYGGALGPGPDLFVPVGQDPGELRGVVGGAQVAQHGHAELLRQFRSVHVDAAGGGGEHRGGAVLPAKFGVDAAQLLPGPGRLQFGERAVSDDRDPGPGLRWVVAAAERIAINVDPRWLPPMISR